MADVLGVHALLFTDSWDRENARRAVDRAKLLPVGNRLLGRIVDGAGRPLDRHGPLNAETLRPLLMRANRD